MESALKDIGNAIKDLVSAMKRGFKVDVEQKTDRRVRHGTKGDGDVTEEVRMAAAAAKAIAKEENITDEALKTIVANTIERTAALSATGPDRTILSS